MVGDELRTFLRDYIDSYECLEILLLLRRERTAWTSEALCAHLKARKQLIDSALAALVRGGLVRATEQGMLTLYTYVDEHPGQDALVASLECAYREHPVPIMRLMSANAIERLRTGALRAFADAFVFKMDKRS